MNLPPYPKYKASGVEWLGDVPEHWEVKKLRHLALFKSGENITSEELEDDGIYPVYGGNGLRGYSSEYTHEGDFALIGRQGALCGNVNYAGGRFWASEHAVVVLPICKFVTVWMGELLRAMNLNQYSVSAAQPGLAVEAISALRAPVPSEMEQHAIADFLGQRTAKMDALMVKKRALIEKLKEKRSALISRTVTKGLPPEAAAQADLPTQPKLKPSGSVWLGDIPEHWVASKMGHAARMQAGYAYKSEIFGTEGVAVVRMNNLKRGDLALDAAGRIDEDETLPEFALHVGDLVWGMSGSIGETGSLGNYARVTVEDLPAQLNQRVGRFIPDSQRLSIDFLTFVIRSEFFYTQILLFVTGTAQFNVSSGQVQSTVIPLPPLAEQRAIADFLCDESAKLDGMIQKVETAIEKLTEYRTALITAAVTGKIDVRRITK